MELEYETVTDFQTRGPGFQVITDCAVRECRALILAAGVRHRALGLPGEGRAGGPGYFLLRRVRRPLYPGRPVAVVGAATLLFRTPCFWPGPAPRSP